MFLVSMLSLEGIFNFYNWVVAIGDASYSLDILHPYVIQFIQKKIIDLDQPTFAAIIGAVVAVTMCWLAAHLCFIYFERPANRFVKKNMIGRRSATGGERRPIVPAGR